MLTRLRVSGFKNLDDVDVRFGAFTCIAGVNGVGKSNLFDAIKFLSDLADDKTLIDAAMLVRDKNSRTSDVTGLFRKYKDEGLNGIKYAEEMTFDAEMIVPRKGVDDLGQEAEATATFLRYSLKLAYRKDNGFSAMGGLEILEEALTYIMKGEAAKALPFAPKAWRDSVVFNKRGVPFISTDSEKRVINLHQDGKQGGSPVRRNAKTLPRTVLSSTNAAENPTALLARNEMRSWALLQLEPSSLRKPDEFTAPTKLGEDGAHLAATLHRLAHTEYSKNDNSSAGKAQASRIYGQVASRISELISDVYAVEVDRDEKRELLTLQVTDKNRMRHPARSLSDGTLRFLALTVIDLDPMAQGVLCLEEPENGIHPARIPAMLKLLQDIAVDVEESIDRDNPLRQVIINTHSPAVVQQVPDDSLLVAESKETGVYFSCLEDTWRAKQEGASVVAKGKLLAYLNPVESLPEEESKSVEQHLSPRRKSRRVIDRPDLQPFLPYTVTEQ